MNFTPVSYKNSLRDDQLRDQHDIKRYIQHKSGKLNQVISEEIKLEGYEHAQYSVRKKVDDFEDPKIHQMQVQQNKHYDPSTNNKSASQSPRGIFAFNNPQKQQQNKINSKAEVNEIESVQENSSYQSSVFSDSSSSRQPVSPLPLDQISSQSLSDSLSAENPKHNLRQQAYRSNEPPSFLVMQPCKNQSQMIKNNSLQMEQGEAQQIQGSFREGLLQPAQHQVPQQQVQAQKDVIMNNCQIQHDPKPQQSSQQDFGDGSSGQIPSMKVNASKASDKKPRRWIFIDN